MNITLVKLTPQYRRQLNDMMEQWLSAEQDFSPYAIRRNDYRDFDYYLEHLETKQEQDGRVPDSTYFCLDLDRKNRKIFIIFQKTLDLPHAGGCMVMAR